MKKVLALLMLLPSVVFGQGTTPTTQVKTIADLVALPIPVISTRLTAIVTGRLTTNDGFGGIFVYDPNSTASTNMGTIFKPATTTGRWTRQYADPLNAGWFGATGGDATDDTVAITNAISIATNTTSGAVLEFPVGSFRHTGLTVVNNLTLQGQGQILTKLLYVGTGSAISKGAATTSIERFAIRNLSVLQATDGQGGIGLDLDSFRYAELENVTVGTFRNAGDTGIGLRMLNTHAICAFNRFVNLTVENCDTAILQDSSNAAFATGYSFFGGLVIYQDKDCIQLKNTLANGGSYNVFSGVQIQGAGAAAGTGKVLYIEGSGNSFYGVVVDQPGTNYILEFNKTSTTANSVEFSGGFDAAKYVNNQTSGAANWVFANGYFTWSPGKRFTVSDPLGAVEASFQSAGNAGTEIHLGNAGAGTQAWRLLMQASATPYFRLSSSAGGVSMEWASSYHRFCITALEKMRLKDGGLVIEPSNVLSDPVASAALDVRSTSKGILPPRMTSAERTAIGTPADGLFLYQSDSTPAFYGRVNSVWTPFLTGASGAPIASPFVTAAADATLTGERTLTGTANQVVVTDGGANSTLTLSAPQNLDTAAAFRVDRIGLGLAPVATSGTLSLLSKLRTYNNAAPTDGQLLIGDTAEGAFDAATITGTANQVSVANGPGSVTLSLPQSIATTSGVTFGNVTDSALTAGRVTFAGAAGILTDDADLRFFSATNLFLVGDAAGDSYMAVVNSSGSNPLRVFDVGSPLEANTEFALINKTGAGAYLDSRALGTGTARSTQLRHGGAVAFEANFNGVDYVKIGTFYSGTLADGTILTRGATGLPVSSLETDATATTDNVVDVTTHYDAATTDGAATTIATIPITASRTYGIVANVRGRRTGGVAGTADDGAFYVRHFMVTTKAGTVTANSTGASDTAIEDQAGFNVTGTGSGANFLLQVTGATDNNVDWHATVTISYLGN